MRVPHPKPPGRGTPASATVRRARLTRQSHRGRRAVTRRSRFEDLCVTAVVVTMHFCLNGRIAQVNQTRGVPMKKLLLGSLLSTAVAVPAFAALNSGDA